MNKVGFDEPTGAPAPRLSGNPILHGLSRLSSQPKVPQNCRVDAHLRAPYTGAATACAPATRRSRLNPLKRGPAMTAAENKARILDFYHARNTGVTERLRGYYAPDVQDHGVPFGFAPGVDGVLQLVAMVGNAFPDLVIDVADLLAEDDRVVVRLRARGTHQGAYFGLPATGKPATWEGMQVFRLAAGRIVEVWGFWDRLAVMRQLGFVMPGAPGGVQSFPDAPSRPAAVVAEPADPRVAAANKAIVRRLIEEVLNQGRTEVADEIVADDFVAHPLLPDQTVGREGIKVFAQAQLTSAPDWKITIADMIAEGDKVAIRATGYGTPRRELVGIPAAGKWIALPWIGIYRLRNGLVAERWMVADWLGTLDQAGALPSMQQTPD